MILFHYCIIGIANIFCYSSSQAHFPHAFVGVPHERDERIPATELGVGEHEGAPTRGCMIANLDCHDPLVTMAGHSQSPAIVGVFTNTILAARLHQ